MSKEVCVFWFRRDLRLHDNAGLAAALSSGYPVLPVFIFDKNILSALKADDARVSFIHDELAAIRGELEKQGSSLLCLYDTPEQAWNYLCSAYDVREVWCNRDYEPYARERDKRICDLLNGRGIQMKGARDSVIFEKSEIEKDNGTPYTVFTPYSRKWKSLLTEQRLTPADSESRMNHFIQTRSLPMPGLEEMGFTGRRQKIPSREVPRSVLQSYATQRDLPAVSGTSRLSVHLRFGTVSIRKLVSEAKMTSEKWLDELIWREFYQMILYHFPQTVNAAFKPAYDRIQWVNDPNDFELWCAGKTGYPLVDAGMRELNETGFMHNRVRMVVASFLSKHLLIDWRWGERYFASKLLDFDLASNVGGWQWSAGCGCDAAPYFRIFNPSSQAEKFDPENRYIRTWVPEFGTPSYPRPMVDHKFARDRCLRVFKQALEA